MVRAATSYIFNGYQNDKSGEMVDDRKGEASIVSCGIIAWAVTDPGVRGQGQRCVRYGTGILGTGVDVVPKLRKCPVPVLMSYRTYRSVRYRY